MRHLGTRRRAASAGLAVALALAVASPAGADELTGTLKKVKESRSIVIGYREASVPFSFLNRAGQPIGYSIDLCGEIVNDVVDTLGVDVAIKYRAVTSASRIPAVQAGDIDLECGSTTGNTERKKLVAFSPVFFVSGTKLMVRKTAPVASYRDLRDKTVVVTAGTTNEAALRAIVERQKVPIKIVVGKDHDESFRMLESGSADAFATDDVLLYGLMATAKSGGDYKVVGDFLSYDPYGLMFRKDDPDFAAVVDRTFKRLAEGRDLVQLYDRWFLMRLPTGERLNLPMSPQLEEMFRVLGVPE
ncbi:amino acid ABC transporter substrate-binding protein [Vineibacter terrae]|uniref:Amino acid ABC transporter substrate-binding protein n=1 Tax=Vineibacter terrae TaxID=2586908 RepID=A0A5C8PFM4_9HYPH|nr:amino acid ABC transporter substrate-binding protein [Vineibacter terrae]TXL72599.1 amino acid ABC transporter substrate-binding protein [Vineibacter terrae]